MTSPVDEEEDDDNESHVMTSQTADAAKKSHSKVDIDPKAAAIELYPAAVWRRRLWSEFYFSLLQTVTKFSFRFRKRAFC